ncbi:hypothetical protein AJR21_024255 [Shigella dysenteriae]|nr:hypothetical protein AJR21_024255 [Shigella dysenteriae]
MLYRRVLGVTFQNSVKSQYNNFKSGTGIKNCHIASSPEMINSGIMCALCDYNENKNHHTPFNIREPDITP